MSENKDILDGIRENINSIEDKPLGTLDRLKQQAQEKNSKDKDLSEDSIQETVDKLGEVFKPKKRTPDLVTISITIREDQVFKIDRICKSLDKNRSEFLRELFDVIIETYE